MTSPDPAPRPAPAGESARAGEPLRLVVIANPHASGTTDGLLRRVVAMLSERHHVEATLTRHQGHAIELCAAAVRERVDAVVALGGDGTINEVVNGLVGSSTALAPLPGGATNVYTRMLGLPRDVLGAAGRLASPGLWRERRVDLGRVQERWFTFAAGIGLDASVVERVDRRPDRKARWGPWFFAAVGVSVFLRGYVRRPPRLEVEVGGRRIPAVSVLLQNGNPYTYFGERPIVLAPDVGLESRDLGGAALTRASALDLPPVLWRALSGAAPVAGHPRVEPLLTRDGLVIRSLDGRPIPLQVDGDHLGASLEVRCAIAPGALRVLA